MKKVKNVETHEGLLSVADLARILGCGRTKAWEIVHSNEIQTVRLGRLVRLERGAIEKFIENKRQ